MKSCRETLAILLLFAFSIFPSSAQTICDEVAPQVLEFISAGVSFIYAMTPIDQPLATVQNYSLSLSTTTCGLDYYFGASDEESEGPFHFDPSSIIFQGFLGTGDSLPSLTLTSSLMGKNAYISFVTRAWCCQDVCDVTISRMRACTTLSDPCTASDGGLCLNPGEEVDISGDPTIIGDLDTFQGSTLVVGSATVIVNGNANIRGTIEITRCTSGTHTALRATGSLNVTGIVKMKCTKCRIPSISSQETIGNTLQVTIGEIQDTCALSTKVIAGIAAGTVIGGGLLALLLVLITRKYKQKNQQNAEAHVRKHEMASLSRRSSSEMIKADMDTVT